MGDRGRRADDLFGDRTFVGVDYLWGDYGRASAFFRNELISGPVYTCFFYELTDGLKIAWTRRLPRLVFWQIIWAYIAESLILLPELSITSICEFRIFYYDSNLSFTFLEACVIASYFETTTFVLLTSGFGLTICFSCDKSLTCGLTLALTYSIGFL